MAHASVTESEPRIVSTIVRSRSLAAFDPSRSLRSPVEEAFVRAWRFLPKDALVQYQEGEEAWPQMEAIPIARHQDLVRSPPQEDAVRFCERRRW